MKKSLSQLLACSIAICICTSCSDTNSTTYTDALQPLSPGAVHLTNYFENDIQNSIEHWNKGDLPYSSFVNFFRNGRPTFAMGEFWGKAVRSGSMFYRYTHDPELKEIMSRTMADALSTQQPNGSISCVPAEKQPDDKGGDLWERKYTMLGMEDYYEYIDADPMVMQSLCAQADCIIEQIGDAPKASITSLGWSPNNIESSTLLEPFMRLYNLTGKEQYLEFATYIVKSGGAEGYNIIQQAYDNIDPHKMGGQYPKAYEMLSLFEGLVEYYRVTGDEYCRTAFMNLYHKVCEQEITIIGNAGADQPYHPKVNGEAWDNTAVEQTNPDIKRMMETCVGVTWMKFCTHLLRLTGDSSPADMIEKYLYNGLLGAMKNTGDGFSYVNLLNGQKVTNHGWGGVVDGKKITCCNLNGPMGLAYIPYIAVMQGADGPVINLYNGLTAQFKTPSGANASLIVDTQFPLSDQATITMGCSHSERFTVKLRIPQWSENTIVTVNGRKVRGVANGTFLNIRRTWKRGDKIDINFDIKARLIDAPQGGQNPQGANYQAVIYGPIVLARDENIDSLYSAPVKIIADNKGIVDVRSVTPTLSTTRMEFIVPTADGDIHMTDYASVDCWEGSHICTWLPIATEVKL